MTAALSHGKDLIIGHIGDSRAYLLRGGKLKRLTRDHTLGEKLSAEGIVAESDPLLTELRNVLERRLVQMRAIAGPMFMTTSWKMAISFYCAPTD